MNAQRDLFGVAPSKVKLDRHWIQRVRVTDPETSRDAAKALTVGKLTDVQAQIIDVLRPERMTDRELVSAYRDCYGMTAESTIRTRRKELVDMGKVEAVGKRDGQTVWAVKGA